MLYEVITNLQRSNFSRWTGLILPYPLGYAKLTQSGHRITSYNVCYTKLLREQGVMINGLNDFRNDLIREEKPTEDVDELLLKVIEAPTIKQKKKACREER